ncbi:MAG: 1-(5-phosphoribosyl)-5-[(5-phosphoribosylamino)methylideneamino]imidazole-4-carboxamide isomerase [Firmicutes bacterium]|nr:1-(5-phosphoribosyl)-5-[(5-phosphoribosylamino)methylideneamino]imidazole-4-carboxamide isomerase [Bacillota bacterium]
MQVFAAIDLYHGEVVRLYQGDFQQETLYSSNPAEVARRWEAAGASWLHVVDLDGARSGRPQNIPALRQILQTVRVPVQVGGGLRRPEDLRQVFELGVTRVILGTAALEGDFLSRCLAVWGPERVRASLDIRDGKVFSAGWQEGKEIPLAVATARFLEAGLKEMIVTDVGRDGTLQGPNIPLLRLVLETGISVIAAGGVSSLEDLRSLKELEPEGLTGAIIGKALYDGRVDLREAIVTLAAS